MSNTLDAARVQDYLDQAINHWNIRRKNGLSAEEIHMATNYMDAFQNARLSLLGSKLPVQ